MTFDLRLAVGSGVFALRVGGLIMEGDQVLLVGNDRDNYLYTVGGAVGFGETADYRSM